MTEFHVRARSTAAVPTVRDAVLDVASWPRWQPISSAVRTDRSAVGILGSRWELHRFGSRTDVEIVEAAEHKVSYVTHRLMGMNSYRSDIELVAANDGTTGIEWHGSFDPTSRALRGFWRWYLTRHMGEIATGLARYAERSR